jgi:8-oxo-dGTP pyrophosphatase MutT (NUDIX family)
LPKPWFPHVTVAAVAERDGQFLLVEERTDGQLVLNQPAGHWERGETLIEAVHRETWEEAAWRFTPEALVGIYRWIHPQSGTTYLRFAFCGMVFDHDPDTPLDKDIQRTVWMSASQIRGAHNRLRSPLVLAVIDDYLDGKRYPLHCIRDLVNLTISNQDVSCVN